MSPNSPVNGVSERPSEVVAAALRALIESGELEPGAKLPTQRELEVTYQVKRAAVRKALEVLNDEGLLKEVGRGSPPVVAERRPAVSIDPRPAGIELADQIFKAFTATKHVTLDAFSLTSETLNNALSKASNDILDNKLDPPRSITARLIVPTPGAKLALPRSAVDLSDDRPLRRLRSLIVHQAQATQQVLVKLKERGVSEVSVNFRTVPITPTHKLYLLNKTELLTGHYVPQEETVEYLLSHPPVDLDIIDVRGLVAKLFHHSSAPGAPESDQAYVEEAQLFFDRYWELMGEPFHPGAV